MATQTEHLHLDLREASDLFNTLSNNSNFETLDNVIYEIQQKGGVPTYTTTAAANLLKLSGTPAVNDTVFKFVAAGDANTWTAGTGGVINNIVALDGKQATIKSGNLYVAWINSANAMVVIAWPEVVNAQTFDGKSPAEWATKAQLDAVNETAGNATQTAQAAATVANNALEVARAAGVNPELLWENTDPTSAIQNGYVYNLSKDYTQFKYLMFVLRTGTSAKFKKIAFTPIPATNEPVYVDGIFYNDDGSAYQRRGFYPGATNTQIEDDGIAFSSNTGAIQKTRSLIPLFIYGIK